ncbi:MAG: polysaccharide deacetylase family protein [Acidobacteria bacterium]|nr:polysaccharide deacetylase family protein [Acidobacteriota bacterium]
MLFLMYHELWLPGRAPCRSEPGYLRYVVSVSDFEQQMRWLKNSGWSGVAVTEALSFPSRPCIALTFDDGSETDLLAAAPILEELGFGATFFITSGFLNSAGHLSSRQLRQLADRGFEVGCHSMTHSYLPRLDASGLRREMVDAKRQIEDVIGQAVSHFSCPGGRYDQRVINMARRTGYRTLSTSRNHPNSAATDVYRLGRVGILRHTSFAAFQDICRGKGLWRMRMAELARTGMQRVLGDPAYDALRAYLLGRHHPFS